MLQPITGGIISTPTSIVRLNQPLSNSSSNQFVPQTVWTTSSTPGSPRLQYSPVMKSGKTPERFRSTFERISRLEPVTSNITQQPTKLVAQPVVSRSVPSVQAPKFTDTQINDFVAKCRTFLLTLLKLAEKQAPEKLPMVRSCIQDLLNGTIDPESFTQRLHTLYKSQPHTSLVPFFKVIHWIEQVRRVEARGNVYCQCRCIGHLCLTSFLVSLAAHASNREEYLWSIDHDRVTGKVESTIQ